MVCCFIFWFLSVIIFNFILEKVPENKRLPYVVINSEVTFFSLNAAICYYLPPPENVALKVYHWLEWEASILCPALAQLGGSVKNENKERVLNLLKYLEKELNSDYVVDVSLTNMIFSQVSCGKESNF